MRFDMFRVILSTAVIALASLLGSCTSSRTAAPQHSPLADYAVTNNFREILRLLIRATGDRDRLPLSLSELGDGADPSLFICPGTGSRPGTIAAVDEWMDFIYIGGVCEALSLTAVLVSPPENHGDKYGFVLTSGGYLACLGPKEIAEVIARPWLMDTNASAQDLDYLRQGLSVHIPPKFRNGVKTK